jgi:hypothetical protein
MDGRKLSHGRIKNAFVLVVVRDECLPPAGNDKQEQKRRKKDSEPRVYLTNPLNPFCAHRQDLVGNPNQAQGGLKERWRSFEAIHR